MPGTTAYAFAIVAMARDGGIVADSAEAAVREAVAMGPAGGRVSRWFLATASI
jgi:hypothetical protein